ncbi:MAG: phage tail tape measure protein [Parcubacteria group bacterium]
MALTAAELEIVLKARDDASKALDTVRRKTKELGDEVGGLGGKGESSSAKLSASLTQMGGSLTSVGKNLTMGVTAPIVGIGVAAAKMAGDFESQINILTVAARSSGTAMEDLSAAALSVGADTELVGITAAGSADAMTSLYKAGFDTAEIFGGAGGLNSYLNENASLTGALRSSIDLAAASELDLAQATDATIVAMKTFGLAPEEASRVANSFVRTADASVASVGDLVAAMTNVGPTAAAFGWSLETTNTALGILSSRGITGAEAGTALKSMMTNLMRPTDAVVGQLKALDVSLYDSEGKLKDLPVIMGELEKALAVSEDGMGGLTEQQRLEAIQTLAGTYGMKAMNTLLAEGATGWGDMETAVSGAASVEDSAAARTTGFNAAMEQLGGALETIAIIAGGPLITALTNLLQGPVAGFLDKISKLNPAVWDWVLKIGLVVVAVGPLLLVLGTMLTTVGSVITIVTTLAPLFAGVGAAIGALIGPVLLIIGAIALLALAWSRDWGGIRTFMTAFWNDTLKPIIEQIVLWFQTNIPIAIATLSAFWTNTLLPAIQAVGGFITGTLVPILQTIWEWLSTNIPAAISAVSGFWTNTLLPAIQAVWAWINENLIPLFRAIVDVWFAAMDLALTAVAGLWENVLLPAIQDVGEWITDKLIPALKDVVEWLGDKFQIAIEAVGNFINETVLPAIKDLAEWFNDKLRPAIEVVADKVSGPLKEALTWLHDKLLIPVKTALGTLGDKLQDVTKFFQGLADKINGLKDKLPSWLTPGSPTPLELGLDGIAESMVDVVQQFVKFGATLKGANLDNLSRFGLAVRDIAKTLKDLASAFHQMNKVEKTEGGIPSLALWAAALKESIIRFSTAIADATREVKDKTIRRAQEFASKIEDIFELLKSFATTLSALNAIETMPDVELFARALREAIVAVTRAITQAVTELGDKAIKAAANMAEHAQKIVGLIGPAVSALGSMATMPEVTDLREKAVRLEEALNIFVYYIKRVADFWEGVALDAAATFSETAGKIVSLVGPAVQAVAAMANMPEATNLRASGPALEAALNIMVYHIRNAALFWEGIALDSAVTFSEAATKVLGLIKPAVDALSALGTYVSSSNLYAAADSLKTDLWILFKKISSIVADIGAIKEETVTFSEDAAKAISFVKVAVDTLTALGAYVSSKNLYAAADSLKTDLWILMKKISSIAADIGTIQEDTIAFSEGVTRAIGFIKPGIDTLVALGEYVSNANLYAAADTLKTDLWILLKKISSIVADIGAIQGETIAFSEGVTRAISFIKPAIETLAALGGYVPGANIYEAVDSLKTDLWLLLKKISSMVADVGAISEETIAFSENVVRAISFIKPGIDALTALGEYEGVKNLFSKLQDFVSDLDLALSWFREIAVLWVTTTEESFTADDLAAIGAFSSNVQAAVAFIKPAIDALESLGKYAGQKKLAGAMAAFETDLTAVVTALGNIAVKLSGDGGIGKANAFSEAASAIKTAIETGLGALSSLSGGGVSSAAEALTSFAAIAKQSMADAVTAIKTGASDIITALKPLPTQIMAIFDAFPWSSIGKAISDGIAQGIAAGSAKITEAAKAAARAALTGAKRELGIASPSKRAREEVGRMFGKGLSLGITDTIGQIRAAMDNMQTAMLLRGSPAYASAGAPMTRDRAQSMVREAANYNLTYVDQRPGGGAPDLLSVAERLEWRARMRR